MARGRRIVASRRVDGGSTNTLVYVQLDDGEALAVKLFARREACVIETAHLSSLRNLAVPRVVHADSRIPVIIYPWLEGRTLAEAPDAGLGEPLGRTLAELAAQTSPRSNPPRVVEAAVRDARARLERGPARDRLGSLADRVLALWTGITVPDAPVLVHGDLDDRKVLVDDRGVVAVVGWDAATTGSVLWDAGSVLRHRNDPAFCADFARGHGGLPAGWQRSARALDATRLVERLDDDAIALLGELVA